MHRSKHLQRKFYFKNLWLLKNFESQRASRLPLHATLYQPWSALTATSTVNSRNQLILGQRRGLSSDKSNSDSNSIFIKNNNIEGNEPMKNPLGSVVQPKVKGKADSSKPTKRRLLKLKSNKDSWEHVEENITDQQQQVHFVTGGTPFDPAPAPFQLSEWGPDSLYTLVLLRHGESEWNKENRYTGWCDVNLTARGLQEARDAGRLLYENHIEIDHAFTSVLKRACSTANIALAMSGQHWVPVTKTWRLNERHYGALQGYNKDTAYRELGFDQEKVMAMRRSYDTPPPPMTDDHPHWHGNDRRYNRLSPESMEKSRCESLKDAAERIMPFFNTQVKSSLRMGNKCIIVSHANTIRTLIKQIDNISDVDIKGISIPTGIPLLYRLDKNLRPVDPNVELEVKYMVEPKGFSCATNHACGFHGVYIGDVERLQDIQSKRDETNRNWQCIILRNIFVTAQNDEEEAGGVAVETRKLLWKVHEKMQTKEFSNMYLLSRMIDKLETMLRQRKRMYLTLEAWEGMLKKLHIDSQGKVVEPFEKLCGPKYEVERMKRRDEILAKELEAECLIK